MTVDYIKIGVPKIYYQAGSEEWVCLTPTTGKIKTKLCQSKSFADYKKLKVTILLTESTTDWGYFKVDTDFTLRIVEVPNVKGESVTREITGAKLVKVIRKESSEESSTISLVFKFLVGNVRELLESEYGKTWW